MLSFIQWLLLVEGQRPSIPPAVLHDYEIAFKQALQTLIQRTREQSLRAKFKDMLDCPIRDNSGQCRSFTDYILSALIKNGIHTHYDIEAAFQYIAEKMLMEKGESGEPRSSVFSGFEERPDETPNFNPLQARFMKYLQYAVGNIRKEVIPRLASVEQRPQGTVSIESGRRKAGEPGAVAAHEIAARRSTDANLSEMIEDITALLEKKEASLGLPLVKLFGAIMSGQNTDQQRARFGDKATRMGRQAIVQTVREYAESTGNYGLLNLLKRFEEGTPTPARTRQKAVKPVLSDKERDYASIIAVLDRLGRPVGSADLGKYRRRWLDYPPRVASSGYRNRLEEVLSSMVTDGVLTATQTRNKAMVYTPGPNIEQYRQEAA